MSSMDSTTPENPLLRRRNSVILPTKLNLQSSPSTTATSSASTATSSASTATSSASSNSSDYELFSIKPVSYTSLRDLMPPLSTVNSPRPNNNESAGGSEISIRNRLVKQAAWAYLQPMSTSPDSDGRSLLSRLFYRSPVNYPVARVIEFVDRFIFRPLTRAVDWLLRAVRIRSSR